MNFPEIPDSQIQQRNLRTLFTPIFIQFYRADFFFSSIAQPQPQALKGWIYNIWYQIIILISLNQKERVTQNILEFTEQLSFIIQFFVKFQQKLVNMKLNIFKIRRLGEPISAKELSESQVQLKKTTEIDSLKASIQNTNDKMMELMTMFEGFMKATVQKTSGQPQTKKDAEIEEIQREVRDRHIRLPLPNSDAVTKEQAEKWMTDVCIAAFSTSFHYYLTEQMTFEQTKVFCSQNVLRNLLLFTSKYKLNDKQIENLNKHIGQKVFQYLQKKYPLTQSNDVNKALQREVQQTNHLDLLTNDFLYTFGIIFKYSPDGNYNDMIMRVINKAIQMVEQPSLMSNLNEDIRKNRGEETSYNDFQSFMSDMFENVYDEDWMIGQSNKTDRTESDAKKVNAEAHKSKYEEKVRSYTNYLIGRKISENTVPYTQAEIKSKNLVIKGPAILRILTKWCQELWQKFESQTYFTQRTESIQLQNPEFINPFFKWMKTSIDGYATIEKKDILAFKAELDSNSYHQQSQFLLKHLQDDYVTCIPKYQKASGKFASQMVKNLHSYITLYLNRLIHGLLTVSKTFFQKKVVSSWDDWQSPPNLMTFKTGDLLRCKMSSKEKEIIKIFKEIKRISNINPKKMKIVRIKNRLKQGTNDILMNVKFNNLIICQIQLEVINKSKSKFIQCSNSFAHYIYEMKRSIFGPVSELCNIWNNLQARAQQYQSLINIANGASTNKVECAEGSADHQLNKFDLPFQCSFCQKLYYHNNYIISNKKCQKCSKYKCVKCQINDMDEAELKKVIFNQKKFKDLSENAKKYKEKTIPNVGICVRIQSTFINIEIFKLTKFEGKTWLLGKKDGRLYNIKQINSPKDSYQFLDRYCIFEITQNHKNFIEVTEKMAQFFSMEEYIKQSYKQEKQVLNMSQIKLPEQEMIELMKVDGGFERNKLKIKRLEFAGNNQNNISYLSCFQNLTTINLDSNNFADMKGLCNFKSLEKLQMRHNAKLTAFDGEVCKLTQIDEIKISNCAIASLPENFGDLSLLTILKMDSNSLTKLPDSLFNIVNLKELSFHTNRITDLPNEIGKLVNLRKLNMGNNKLTSVPASIGQLISLQILDLSANLIKALPENLISFSKLETIRLDANQLETIPAVLLSNESLKTLNLFNNRIKTLPNSFNSCKNIESLSLRKNQIADLPETLGECINLTALTLQQNKFKIIPSFLSKLKHLSSAIDLNNNQLTQFPSIIFEMETVTKLSLQGNSITAIPPNISKLQDLTDLNLKNNKIQALIPELTSLACLKTFAIDNNQLTKIPTFTKDIPAIKNNLKSWETYFRNNKVAEIESCQLFDAMNNSITFTSNQLNAIPINLINSKENIISLNFSTNKIKEIPMEISLFVKLTSLNLTGNLIEVVPKVLEELTQMQKDKLFLDSNPLKEVQCMEYVLKVGSPATKKLVNALKPVQPEKPPPINQNNEHNSSEKI